MGKVSQQPRPIKFHSRDICAKNLLGFGASFQDRATKENQVWGTKEAVIFCIEAQRLDGVSNKHIYELESLQELFGKRINYRIDQGEKLIKTSYKTSIESFDFSIFISVE